jgi:hypothetical protein
VAEAAAQATITPTPDESLVRIRLWLNLRQRWLRREESGESGCFKDEEGAEAATPAQPAVQLRVAEMVLKHGEP